MLTFVALVIALVGLTVASSHVDRVNCATTLTPEEALGRQTNTTGTATGELKLDLATKHWSGSVTFAHLTSPIHLHRVTLGRGIPGTVGEVLFYIGAHADSAFFTKQPADWTTLQAARDGQLYFQIDTEDNPQGELRGQISCE